MYKMEIIVNQTIAKKAQNFAIKCHQEANHKYDKTYPYSKHLADVVNVANQFIDLIPKEDRDVVLAGCWVHDVIEDARQTYNNVFEATSFNTAELAYALTNEKGKTRKERANAKYYEDMKKVPYAVFIKLCDRIANVQYSKSIGSTMFEKYKKENPEFINSVFQLKYESMIMYLIKQFI